MMVPVVLLVYFLQLGAHALVHTVSCPPPEDIAPCYCVTDQKDIRVDCIQANSVEDIRKGFSSLKGHQDIFIDFQRSRLDSIPPDLFKGLHVTKLSFTNCYLKGFGNEGRAALEGLESIIEEFSIHFSFSEDNGLKFLNVSQLHSLYQLEIEGNYVQKLGDDWFRDGPLNLQNLFVMTNSIQDLGDNAFSALEKIKNLWLTGNSFRILKRTMFPMPAQHLVSLDLSDNEIETLPTDLFFGMPSLKEVILSENAIMSIEERTWSPVWQQLSRLYLEDNPLVCDSRIDWTFKVSRPYVLKGRCESPKDRQGQDLKRLIDDEIVEEFDD